MHAHDLGSETAHHVQSYESTHSPNFIELIDIERVKIRKIHFISLRESALFSHGLVIGIIQLILVKLHKCMQYFTIQSSTTQSKLFSDYFNNNSLFLLTPSFSSVVREVTLY